MSDRSPKLVAIDEETHDQIVLSTRGPRSFCTFNPRAQGFVHRESGSLALRVHRATPSGRVLPGAAAPHPSFLFRSYSDPENGNASSSSPSMLGQALGGVSPRCRAKIRPRMVLPIVLK